MKISATISALYATAMLICVFEFLEKDLFYFDKGGLYAWLFFIYLVTLAVSGWRFAVVGKQLSGIIHATLMSGIACVGLIWGFLMFNSESGPDSPVGPEVQLAGLAAIIIGIIAGLCAMGVIWNLKKNFSNIR